MQDPLSLSPVTGTSSAPAPAWGAYQPLFDAVVRQQIDGFYLRGNAASFPDVSSASSTSSGRLLSASGPDGTLFLSPRFLDKRKLSSIAVVVSMLFNRSFSFQDNADAFIVGPHLQPDDAGAFFLQVDLPMERLVFACPRERGDAVLDLGRSIFGASVPLRLVAGNVPAPFSARDLRPADALFSSQGTRPYALTLLGVTMLYLFFTALVLFFKGPILLLVAGFLCFAVVAAYIAHEARKNNPLP